MSSALMVEKKVQFPHKLEFLFRPSRYKVVYGGRGGSKSWGIARALIILATQQPLRILCAREFQNSIQDSVHRLLADQMAAMGLSAFFGITQTSIKGINGSSFLFYGIKTNTTKIKSTEGIDIAWVEEAETVSNESWQILIPTVRKDGSEIWVSFNPNQETDPTFRRFVTTPPDNAMVVPISWRDNPWFPEELRREKDYLARVDVDAYEHVWEGQCRLQSNAQIFKGKYRVEAFDPQADWQGPYFGADWGFAQDPTTLVKMWIYGLRLYVEKEIYKIGLDIDFTPAEFDKIPEAKKHAIRADSARPETISYMERHGYGNLIGVDKWPGSVEEGIRILRSFEEIVIHPACIHTAEEMRLYSYKTDKLTGDVLPEIIDKHNHCIDPIRYGLQPIIKTTGNTGFLDYIEKVAEKKVPEAPKNETTVNTSPWHERKN